MRDFGSVCSGGPPRRNQGTDQMLNVQYEERWSDCGARSLRADRERRLRKYFRRATSGGLFDEDGDPVRYEGAVDRWHRDSTLQEQMINASGYALDDMRQI